MKLTYIYHSCFALETDKLTIIFDYFKDSGEALHSGLVNDYLLMRPGKLYVLSSHSHYDHFNKEILQWKQRRSNIQYILSKDILDCKKARGQDAIFIDKGETYEDDNLFIKAFGSTDAGISFLVEVDDKKIFHAGDLNNWHWNEESTPEEVREAEDFYLRELETLAEYTSQLALAMFPVDPRLGKDYMRGAEQFVSRIQTKIFVPMHFDEEYGKANAFKEYAEAHGCRFISLTHKGETIEV